MGFLILIIIIWLIVLTAAFYDFKGYVFSRLNTLRTEIDLKYPDCSDNKGKSSEKINVLDDNFEIKHVETNLNKPEFKAEVKRETRDIENLFFGNIFNKVGAVVLIIAFGIFLKFISAFIEFTPLLKIILSLVSGTAMVSCAMYLFKNDKMRNYAAVLMGAGFGVLFITVYCAFALYQMLNIYTVLLAAILLLGFSYFIANKYKNIATFIVGLVGAYLSPVIIGSNSLMSINYLFAYLIFVNLVSMAYVSKDAQKAPFNYANMVITCLFVHIWSIKSGEPLIIWPFILWALYLFFDMLLIKLMPKNKTYLCWFNFVVMSSFLISNYFDNEKYLVSLGTLLIGLCYLLCANLIKKYSTEGTLQYQNGAIFALYAAIWFIPLHILKMFSFAIFGFLISFFSKEKTYLQRWGFAYIISSFLMIFSSGELFSKDINEYLNYRYIFNQRTLFYLIPACAAYSVFRFCRKFPVSLAETLRFFGISFCYLFIATEMNILFLKLQNSNISYWDFCYIKNISYVILGCIYSLQLRHLGKASNLALFNYTGYTAYVSSLSALVILSFLLPDSLYYPVLNIRTFAIIFATIVSIFYECKEKVNYFGYISVFLGFLLLNLECNKILENLNALDLNIISTSLWMIYAGALIIPGIFKNVKICKLSGIFIVTIGLLKIFLFDIKDVDAIYKIIAFFITGIILMITSYYYTKKKN